MDLAYLLLLVRAAHGVFATSEASLAVRCNFENEADPLCGWSTDGDQAWRRRSGQTPTFGTGPSMAFEGDWYIYLEASGGNHPYKAFFFQSPEFTENGIQLEVSFAYHMSGSSMGTLDLQYRSAGGWASMNWAKSGHQSNSWHQVSVSIPPNTSAIRFVGTTGNGFKSDMALDSLDIQGFIPAGMKVFEELTCNVDDIEECTIWTESAPPAAWQRVRDAAHQGWWCLQAEGDDTGEREFVWKSAAIAMTSETKVLSLAYQIFGSESVALKIESMRDANWTLLFEKAGDHGSGWHHALILVPIESTAVQAVARTNSSQDVVRLDSFQACAASSGLQGDAACVCSEGEFLEGMVCAPCPAGTFKDLAGNQACTPCSVGKWSNAMGASSREACEACMPGSTTVGEGSTADACMRPLATAVDQLCYSGHPCVVDNVAGYSLREGHRMMISSSDCMDPGKSAVSGVANSGVSEPSSNGRKYEWGMHGPQDFAPNGGIYHVCWCVNMATLTCTDIGGDFVLTAGQLTVVGPSPSKNNLQCIRGSYCADLPFEGHSLSTNDRVAVRREECGSMNGLSLSEGRGDGVGQLQASVGEDLTTDAGHSTGSLMYLGFGAFEEEKDNRLTVDAGSGYNLCWCSSERSNCMEPTDFAVAAGTLSVLGAKSGQDETCFFGQQCTMNVEGILRPGDRLMILADCGHGSPIPGFPGGGIARNTDEAHSTFSFLEDAVLESMPGLYRMCYCSIDGNCESSWNFKARVGLLRVRGPVALQHQCVVGYPCDVHLSGVGLSWGDKVFLAMDESNCSLIPAFSHLSEPTAVEGSEDAFRVSFGELPATSRPGRYLLCWCPVGFNCGSTPVFGAAAGTLWVECAPGFFQGTLNSQPFCSECPRGFFCAGGTATRLACNDRRTTLTTQAASPSQCVCMEGYFFSDQDHRCMPCPKDQFKNLPGNANECTLCANLSTHAEGSVSNQSCVPDVGSSRGNTVNVPAVHIQLFATSVLVFGERERRIVQATLADLSRIPASAIQVRLWNRTIVVHLHHRTKEDAAAASKDLSMNVLLMELRQNLAEQTLDLQDTDLHLSDPELTWKQIECPAHQSVPAGILPTSQADCECSPGYEEVDGYVGGCQECPAGKYKEVVGSGSARCQDCPGNTRTSTVQRAATSASACRCGAGLAEEKGTLNCIPCPAGYFCNGTGIELECPEGSTSYSQARSEADCFCKKGHFRQDGKCEQCERGRYKSEESPDDESQCPGKCPTNADSQLGAVRDLDCFCMEGFYAVIESWSDRLIICENCEVHPNLYCKGGWHSGSRKHMMPVARKGYYQTGLTTAVKCTRRSDGFSSCLGGEACLNNSDFCQDRSDYNFSNACARNSGGVLCGECAPGFARPAFQAACERCPSYTTTWLIFVAAFGLLRVAVTASLVAWLASSAAAKGSLKLHATIQRMAAQWWTVCSILTIFDLDNLRSVATVLGTLSGDAPVDMGFAQKMGIVFPASDVMSTMFSIFALFSVTIPNTLSTDYALMCQAEKSYPGDNAIKLVFVGVYNLCLPVCFTLVLFGLCSLIYAVRIYVKRILGWKFESEPPPVTVLVHTPVTSPTAVDHKDIQIQLRTAACQPHGREAPKLAETQESPMWAHVEYLSEDQENPMNQSDSVSFLLLRIGLYYLWPSLLSSFLRMIWCVPVPGDGRFVNRLVPSPDVECSSPEHKPSEIIAYVGLAVCGLFVIILGVSLHRIPVQDRHTPENFRKYGYFYLGYERDYFLWDILVKRIDIAVMMIVAYTSLIMRETESKLLLFPLISGFQLGLAAAFRPYSNERAHLLDFLEMMLLFARFLMFSAVAVFLLIEPSESLGIMAAVISIFVLAIVFLYLCLHFFADFVHNVDEVRFVNNMHPQLPGFRQRSVARIGAYFKFLRPTADEHFWISWSFEDDKISITSPSFRNKRCGLMEFWRYLVGKAMRFDQVYQRYMISGANADFTTMCIDLDMLNYDSGKSLDDDSKKMLRANGLLILCALATSQVLLPKSLPKGECARMWSEVIMTSTVNKGQCTPEDLENALARLWGLSSDHQKRILSAAVDKLTCHEQ